MGMGTNISAKTKGITFATEDNSLIFVSFSASPNTYDLDIPKFEEALKTLKISRPAIFVIQIRTSNIRSWLNEI